MPYKQLEHTADRMFEVTAKTFEKLLLDAGTGLIKTLAKIITVKPKIKKKIKISGNSEEELLFNFLEEIIFTKDSEAMVFRKIEDIKIKNNNVSFTLIGDKIDKEKQELGNDVKAITMHKFQLEKTKSGYKTTFIIDI